MSAMKYLNENPKKPYTQATSLSEIDQKATKCGIGLGKCLCELADELRKDGKTPEPVSEEVSLNTGISQDLVEAYGRVYRNYRAPKTAGLPIFELYYLYRINWSVLNAFIPLLRRHLERVRKGLDSNIWLTKHSIEIELDSTGGGKAWYDLKELPAQYVEALGACVGSRPVSAVASQKKTSAIAPPTSIPVATTTVEVTHADSQLEQTQSSTETLVPSDSTSTASDIESGCMSSIEDGAADSFDNFDWDDANS